MEDANFLSTSDGSTLLQNEVLKKLKDSLPRPLRIVTFELLKLRFRVSNTQTFRNNAEAERNLISDHHKTDKKNYESIDVIAAAMVRTSDTRSTGCRCCCFHCGCFGGWRIPLPGPCETMRRWVHSFRAVRNIFRSCIR